MSTEIAERQPYDRETNQLMVLAQQAFASGLFKALKSPAEAFVRMAVAKEMGLGPTTGLRAIYLVNGTPAFSAGFMAARVKSSRRYNYKVIEKTALKCCWNGSRWANPLAIRIYDGNGQKGWTDKQGCLEIFS